jgi:hypothetical protein
MEVLGRGPVGELGVQGRRYQGDVPYPGDEAPSSPTVLKRLLGNRWCLARDSDPSSLIKVPSQSEAPLRQRAV